MASPDNVPESVSAEPHQAAVETQQIESSTSETIASPNNETTTDTPQPSDLATTASPEKPTAAVDDNGTAESPTATTMTQSEIMGTNLIPEATTAVEGESSDQSKAAVKEAEVSGPSLMITLLLTTGARHPFKIDSRYLRKRGVNVENYDPFSMSVYTLKELIWREWRSEWEPRPASPSSIRLISFGKLLDDKSPLSESRFNHDAPNVIHMTVKPQEVVDEEDAKGGKSYQGRDRDATERSPHCRCVIL